MKNNYYETMNQVLFPKSKVSYNIPFKTIRTNNYWNNINNNLYSNNILNTNSRSNDIFYNKHSTNTSISNIDNVLFSTVEFYNYYNKVEFFNSLENNTAKPIDYICYGINEEIDDNNQYSYCEKEINKAIISAAKQIISDLNNKGLKNV